jgi:mannan endo-1,4-beta-mannosidase
MKIQFTKILLTPFLVLVNLFLFAQEKTTMYVKGKDLYSACGEKVVIRGVNEMFIWSKSRNGSMILPEIAKTGANGVRLVWTTQGSVEELDALIGNCLKEQMIPIPELHDATGDFSKLPMCLAYWTRPEVLKIIQKYKKWVIVNIANEVGMWSDSDQKYEEHYKKAITQLREAGIDVPLMIDAGSWGNNERYVVNTSESLMAHDPLHNLIFSVHTYWGGDNQHARLDTLINTMKRKKMPLIFAEGPQKAKTPQDCTSEFPYLYMIDRCQQEGIGWMSWSWGAADNGDCGSPNSVFDMTTDGVFGHWANTFAEDVCVKAKSSIQKTSKRPVSLVQGKCKVSP